MASAAREGEARGKANAPSLRFDIEAPGVPTRTIELRQDIVRIGKLSSSHLQIQDAAVSRVHAVIEVTTQGDIFVIDLGSSNGTYVNGAKVSKERLHHGDTITLGQTKITMTVNREGGESHVTPPTPLPPSSLAAAPLSSSSAAAAPLAAAPLSSSSAAAAPLSSSSAAAAPLSSSSVAAAPLAAAPPAAAPVLASETPTSKEEEGDDESTHAGLPSRRGAATPSAAPGLAAAGATAAKAAAGPAEARPGQAAVSAPAPSAPAPSAPAPSAPAPSAPAPSAPAPSASAPSASGTARSAPAAEPRRAPLAPRPSPASSSAGSSERRFIAVAAAEPLSSQVNDAAGLIEVRLAFGRDIIETRTFEVGRAKGHGQAHKRSSFRRASVVTIGSATSNDFIIEGVEGIDGRSFSLLRATPEGYVLRFTADMLGRVRLGDEDVALSDLRTRPETTQHDGAFEWPFRRGAMVSLKAGGTTLYLRTVPKAPPAPVRLFEATDPRLVLSFLGVALFTGALVWRAVTWPEIPSVLLEDKNRLDERMVNMLINPEERLRRAKIAIAKGKDKDAAAKDKEGKASPKDDKKEDVQKRLAVKEKKEELTLAQRRERDIKKVRTLGALEALSKDATLKEIMAGGGGPGSLSGIGGGGSPDDMNEWGGLNNGPPGEGTGLGGFGTEGGATGGGGVSRYVGVGRLRTRGIRGGKGGTKFGQGEAKIDDHEVRKPEVQVGEADVTGGLTKEIIRRVIRSHIHEVRYCYERELVKQPRLYGKVVVKFTILPSGNVHQSAIKSSTMGNENVEGCILARVNRWSFPKPYKGSSVIVSYPFIFKAAGKD